jgi:hypothetical protein
MNASLWNADFGVVMFVFHVLDECYVNLYTVWVLVLCLCLFQKILLNPYMLKHVMGEILRICKF